MLWPCNKFNLYVHPQIHIFGFIIFIWKRKLFSFCPVFENVFRHIYQDILPQHIYIFKLLNFCNKMCQVYYIILYIAIYQRLIWFSWNLFDNLSPQTLKLLVPSRTVHLAREINTRGFTLWKFLIGAQVLPKSNTNS